MKGERGKNSMGLKNIAVVLQQPGYSENIGAAARAMCNMGMDELHVVAARNFNSETAEKLATHSARHIVQGLQHHTTLAQALAPFHYVVGTTARLGGERRVMSPRQAAEQVIPIARNNRVALLFGREDTGLSNDALKLCHTLIHIPTSGFSSLNLSQAVMVMCHELFSAALADQVSSIAPSPRLAGRYELDGMYDELELFLNDISLVNPEKSDYWLNHLRRFFNRFQLRAGEVRMIRAMMQKISLTKDR